MELFLIVILLLLSVMTYYLTSFYFRRTIASKIIPDYEKQLRDQATQAAIHLDKTVAERIKRSKSVIDGQKAEQVAPFLPEFPYDAQDARFLGSPIDFVVFDGLSKGDLKEIVIVEVKTGKSSMTPRERAIKKACKEGRVSFREVRLKRKDAKTS